MSSTTPLRPAQANLAIGLILGGSVLVIASAWQRIGGLHSMEMQQSLAKFVARESFSGVSVATLTTTLRILCIVGAAAAAAAAILAVQVPQRSRSARIVLTALAPLVFLGWFGTSGFFEPFVLCGILLLWLPPTSDWYDGRDPAARAVAPTQLPPPQLPAQLPPPPQAPLPPPVAHTPVPQAWVTSAYPPLSRRPASVVRACVITWVCTALTTVAMVASAVWLASSGDAFVNQVIDQGHQVWGSMADQITETQVRVELYVLLAGFVVWCLAAAGLALLLFLGHAWARILLVISAIGAGVCAVVGAVAFPPLLLVVASCIVATVLLLRPDAGAWRR